ncbi:MAG: hypothetical protein C0599_05960 [Salinivirgaceae bacterium]|nr:MAG: hypothetical protein C0599_05960 [Salinivirgaceae bacterium]
MKLLTLTLTLTFFATTIFAQTADTLKAKKVEMDTAIIQVKGKKIIIIEEKGSFEDRWKNWDKNNKDGFHKTINIGGCWEKKFDGHYGGVELGINNFLNKDMEMILPEDAGYLELEDSRSIEFSLNLVDVAVPIVKNRLGLVTGLGFTWNNYHLDNKQLLLQNDGDSLYAIEDTVASYSKNKLNAVFVNVPLMLEFQQPIGNKDFWIAVGGYAGVKIGSSTKLKTNDGDKTKTRKDFHMNTLRYGLRAQVGFENFGVYCNYSLQSLFKKNEGPELYPISLGVTLAF